MTAAAAVMEQQTFHVRSVSLQSRSRQPVAIKVEEELQRLKTAATSMSSSTEICDGLRGLGDLYACVGDLLHLPSLQQTVFCSKQRKRLEEELEASLLLLDLVDNMRELVATAKGRVQGLQSDLRRRSATSPVMLGSVRKEMQKNVNKCYKLLRKMDEKGRSSVSLEVDCGVLIESRDATICVLRSALGLLAMACQKPKWTRWLWTLKPTQTQRASELGESLFYSSSQLVQEQMDAAEATMEAVETELQRLLRRLIQWRVCFLNFLSLN
ncbi:uncharacterized protein LOC141814350 [Curcuma longa]|uniref:uncharacterized protein LOC141814350 n=1 Tax=Curcuma longa TaxID=136217 RepID=UPI003D9EF6AD